MAETNFCSDCGAPSGRFKRCLIHREKIANAAREWYWRNIERERPLRAQRMRELRAS